jgi:isoleucyl-tRNA synthetase
MTIIKIINNHVIELSSWYFDLIKDTLYCENANHPARRAIQTVLHHVLLSYLKLLAPIIPHTAEEVYACWSLPHKQASITLESYKLAEIKTFNIDKSKWEYFFKLKGLVYTELEKIRINKEINKNNQALVEISFSNENKFDEKNLARFLNVALVKFNIISGNEIQIKVSNANLLRCERCWNYFDSSKMADEHLCVRCSGVIKDINN